MGREEGEKRGGGVKGEGVGQAAPEGRGVGSAVKAAGAGKVPQSTWGTRSTGEQQAGAAMQGRAGPLPSCLHPSLTWMRVITSWKGGDLSVQVASSSMARSKFLTYSLYIFKKGAMDHITDAGGPAGGVPGTGPRSGDPSSLDSHWVRRGEALNKPPPARNTAILQHSWE